MEIATALTVAMKKRLIVLWERVAQINSDATMDTAFLDIFTVVALQSALTPVMRRIAVSTKLISQVKHFKYIYCVFFVRVLDVRAFSA
jgi:hypothetical protein